MSSSIKLSPVSPSSASPPSITTSPPPPTTTQQQNITTSISMDSTSNQIIKITPTPSPAPIITINPSSPSIVPASKTMSPVTSGTAPVTHVVPVSAPTPSITETIINEVKNSYGKNSLLISSGIALVATLIIKLIINHYSPNSGWLGFLYLVIFFTLVFGLLYYFINK